MPQNQKSPPTFNLHFSLTISFIKVKRDFYGVMISRQNPYMIAKRTCLQCRGNEAQHSELKTAAPADNKLCSFVKFRGTNKSSTSGFQLATEG